MPIEQSRRRFLGQLGIAGAAGMGGLASIGLGSRSTSFAAEPPPEVTTIRLEKDLVTCIAPQAAEELLRAEGFTNIRYVDMTEAHLQRAESAKSGPVALGLRQCRSTLPLDCESSAKDFGGVLCAAMSLTVFHDPLL